MRRLPVPAGSTARHSRRSLGIQGELGLTKAVVHGGKVRFVLNLPAWPSRAYGRMVARGGLSLDHDDTTPPQYVQTAFLNITGACPLRCQHCYARDGSDGMPEMPASRWKTVLRDLQDYGVGVVVLSGGEPMCRFDDLIDILSCADTRLSEFHVHTSGYGVTPERARRLYQAGITAAGIGFDHWDPARFDAIRGYPGALAQATQAIRCYQEAGAFTYVNTCLTKELVRSGGLPRLLDVAKAVGVGIVRLLDPKPCGGYFGVDPGDLFSQDDRDETERFFLEANSARRFRRHPAVLMPSHTEAPQRLGCRMGGQSILEIDSRGNVLPCIFVPVSFGNVGDDHVATILARMTAAVPHPVRSGCPAFTLADAIHDKVAAGSTLPVTYEQMKREFDAVVEGERAVG